jgi:aminoglycoside phosphotransferase (APT) family kinase protein
MATDRLDIEQFDALLPYLRAKGLLGPTELPRFSLLSGGVSNRTVLIQHLDGHALVLKQALERLRVSTEWLSDPRRVTREALGLTWLARLAPPGTITPLVFLDEAEHLLAMEAVPQPHANWKTLLLHGGLQPRHVQRFGELLAIIHRRSFNHAELAGIFGDRQFFRQLRLEPYYRYAAQEVAEARQFLEELICETLATSVSLVHGDYSPKNVLIYRDDLVLLDHEVIHFGDGAFDVGFALTHLLSKAHHVAQQRVAFLAAAGAFWKSYTTNAGSMAQDLQFEPRAIRHTLACLLARVRGRSPLEYLTDAERRVQERAVLELIRHRPAGVADLVDGFGLGVTAVAC